MPTYYTDEEKSFIEELSNMVDKWKVNHDWDLENYSSYSNDDEEKKNKRMLHLSGEIYAYYYNLRDDLENLLDDIHKDYEEYCELTGRKEG